jgi:hypothetical protein
MWDAPALSTNLGRAFANPISRASIKGMVEYIVYTKRFPAQLREVKKRSQIKYIMSRLMFLSLFSRKYLLSRITSTFASNGPVYNIIFCLLA